jgi:N-acetylglucosaminyldiphosphoundecaprenol N-acetyl-beta-D-mannosaminyltransferase
MATDASRTGFRGSAEPPSWTVTSVLGVQVAVSSNVFAAALELKQRGGGQIVTLNAEMTMAARANPELGAAIAQADLVIPDGAGVVGSGAPGLSGASQPGD